LNAEPTVRYQLIGKGEPEVLILSRLPGDSILDSVTRQEAHFQQGKLLNQGRVGLKEITEAGRVRAPTAEEFNELAAALSQIADSEITVYDAS
jgi:hypothetical protein